GLIGDLHPLANTHAEHTKRSPDDESDLNQSSLHLSGLFFYTLYYAKYQCPKDISFLKENLKTKLKRLLKNMPFTDSVSTPKQ
ncbi:hypothetical protein, partial [Phocaeicola coprocola]|uniref:hypothetical protein n=2 Tax=Phocaeicola coprocola TaxID=310298 RepID=UPI0022E2FC6F